MKVNKKDQSKINKIIKEIGLVNKKMIGLKKASDVEFVFDKMDDETKDAVKSLINHLMVARAKKEYGIE